MDDPMQFFFFCSEADYPKFRALFPDKFPPTYHEFVSMVDKSIKDQTERVTVNKAAVGFDEFLSFCNLRGEVPNYNNLVECAMQIWGHKW